MDFGLGLVLSFVDNATAGINNAVNSLNQLTHTAENATNSMNQMASLSALSVVSGQLGNSFTSMGRNIISTFSQIIGKVNETGQTLMYAENQLGKLYESSGRTGKEVIGQIQDYAKTSIFEFENLIPSVIMLKANGIEAFEEIASSTGKSKQLLMDYAADLAAFNPNMRNMYGSGIQAAMGALNEYIAEGNARSLKQGASLDILQILGEDKGATIEERSRQVADLLEKLEMVGMTAQMADSPMTKLSNMQDTLFQFIGKVSESGVYDAFNRIINVIAGFVNNIDEDTLTILAESAGSALSSLLAPIEKLAELIVKLASGFVELLKVNPALTKFVTIGTAIGGVLLLVTGVILKATSAFSGLSLMFIASGTSFSSMTRLFADGSKQLFATLLPLIATIGLIALAWKSDFAGIRTTVSNFVSNLTGSFRTASQAVNGSIGDMLTTLYSLQKKDDFFSNLTIGIMKFMTLFKALAEGWNDFELSESTFMKARELGILPLIEAIFDLKYRFDNFKEGFKAGWQEISNNITSFISGIATNVKGTAFESLFDSLTSLFQKLSSGDAQAWYDFGKSFADITANILLFVATMKTIKLGDTAIKGIARTFGELSTLLNGGVIVPITFLGKVFANIATKAVGAFSVIKAGLLPLITGFQLFIGGAGTLAEVLMLTFTPLQGIIAFITGATMAVANFVDMLKNGFSWINELFMILGIAMSTVGAIVAGVAALPAVVVGAVTAAIATFVALIVHYKDELNTALTSMGTSFLGACENMKTLATEFIGSLVTKFNEGVEKIKTFFSNLPSFFSTTMANIKSVFSDIGVAISTAISGAVRGAINKVLSGATSIINGFISTLNGAIGVINALPGVSIPKISKLSVPALAKGGVVESPTVSLIGEAGAEAVMPLENNTDWIGKLANMITSEMRSIVPTNTHTLSGHNRAGGQRYISTNNNSTTQHIQGDTDNSIVFNAGAIQLNVQNATDAEAMRLAKKIMELIKRQRELDAMALYT